MNTVSNTSTSSEKSYFDLHITGVGYVNRIREVTPKKARSESFLACDIAALNGPKDAVEYRRFDVRVSGSEAQHLIRRCEEAVKAERKVLIGFRLGDLWTDIFTYTKGKNAGNPGVSLKARLLFVSWIKVDGEMVYKAEPRSANDAARDDTAPASEADADSPATDTALTDAPADADSRAEAPALAESA